MRKGVQSRRFWCTFAYFSCKGKVGAGPGCVSPGYRAETTPPAAGGGKEKVIYLSLPLLTRSKDSDIFISLRGKYITTTSGGITMKRNQKLLAALGCILFTAYAVWDSLTHHAGRLVYPMNSYAFQPSDIPMLLALLLDLLYVFYLVCLFIRVIITQKKQVRTSNRTRRLSPKLGLLGFLGFLGFGGFWSYQALGDLTAFVFFGFFGFFGFFFEGKMSNTLMDERFQENALRAELKAYRAGFAVIFLLLLIAGQASRFKAELLAPALTSGIALAFALTLFLSEYLLYKYDHDDSAALEEE